MAAILRVKKDGEWIDIPALVGEDGFSPTVAVEDTGDQITITVKDKNGEKATSYGKGAGDMLKSVYDTDGDGKVDKAKLADSAISASSAASAEYASSAANAAKLGGLEPSAYRKTADQIDYTYEIKNLPTIPSVPPVDTEVTAGSGNPVSGGAVKTYVDGKVTGLDVLDLDEFTVTFPASGWTEEPDTSWPVFYQMVQVAGVVDGDFLNYDVNVPYNPENRAAILEAWAELVSISIVDGVGLIARFGEAPTMDLHITFHRTRKKGGD